MDFYIYFYYFNKDIVYIGKTNHLYRRYKEHLRKDFMKNITLVSFTKLKTRIDMNIYEIYYINKYKPKFNIADKHRGTPTFIPVVEPIFKKTTIKEFLDNQVRDKDKLRKNRNCSNVIQERIQKLPFIAKTKPNLLQEMYKQENFSIVYKENVYSLRLYTEISKRSIQKYGFDKINKLNSLAKANNQSYYDVLFNHMLVDTKSLFEIDNKLKVYYNDIELTQEHVILENNTFNKYKIKLLLHPVLVVNFNQFFSLVETACWKKRDTDGRHVLKRLDYNDKNIKKILYGF